jgi:hypothetical protein
MVSQKENDNIAQIDINDSRIFHSFNEDAANKLVKEGQFFQSFNAQIKPCSVRGKEPQDKPCTVIQKQLPYLDVVRIYVGLAQQSIQKFQNKSQRPIHMSA